jgi:2-polyprenyl-3-methyl-5-hydroxy-6-metoxy-1,4-benzoquinol methylase
VAQSYDQLWRGTWGDIQRFGPVHRHTLENLVRTVSMLDVRTILDVGCGSGENLAALGASRRYRLAGAGISQEALAIARSRAPDTQFFVLDVTSKALDEQFDLVISIQVLEHLLDDETALNNMSKMARKFVFISTIQGRMRKSETRIGHLRNYSAPELRRKIKRAGLQVVDMSNWGFPFYSPIYRSVSELLPGGPPAGPLGPAGKLAARGLYHLYRLNRPGRGDVINVLAKRTQ